VSTGAATASVLAPDEAGVLTPEALDLVVELEREFGDRRKELLLARAERQQRISAGELPDFLEPTRAVREGDWRVAPAPPLAGRGGVQPASILASSARAARSAACPATTVPVEP